MPLSVPQGLDLLKSVVTPSKHSSPSLLPSTPRSTSNPPAPTTSAQRNLSAFAPFDRDQFVGRLATFKAVFWGQLPEDVCEFEWARRGWIERRDRRRGVECGLCHASVQVVWDWNQLREKVLEDRRLLAEKNEENSVAKGGEKENETDENGIGESPAPGNHEKNRVENVVETGQWPNSDDDIFATGAADEEQGTALLLKYYTPLLSSGHKSKCPWASKSTDTTVLRLSPQLLSLSNLQSRLTSLSSILESFPSSNRTFLPKPLPASLPSSLTEFDPRTIQAGVAGWSGQILGKRGMLACGTCHRRVGLWTFTKEDGDSLNLIAEHKRYCPWVNAAVQTGMAGWEYVFALLEPKTSLGKRGREGEDGGDVKENRIKKLREMLKSLKK